MFQFNKKISRIISLSSVFFLFFVLVKPAFSCLVLDNYQLLKNNFSKTSQEKILSNKNNNDFEYTNETIEEDETTEKNEENERRISFQVIRNQITVSVWFFLYEKFYERLTGYLIFLKLHNHSPPSV